MRNVAIAASLESALVNSDHKDLDRVEKGEPIPFFFIRPPEPKKNKKKMDLNTLIQRAEQAEHALAEAERRIAELEAQLHAK